MLLTDALAALGRLQAAAKAIHDPAMRAQVQSLAATGDKVVKGVKANPERAMAVRRLLTFYLPNAASLAEGWRALEDRARPTDERVTQTRDTMLAQNQAFSQFADDLVRVTQTRDTMLALNQAFSQFADDLVEPQLQTLDLDLKVLNDALHADLAQIPAPGSIGAHAP
jgi:hypothetical protein